MTHQSSQQMKMLKRNMSEKIEINWGWSEKRQIIFKMEGGSREYRVCLDRMILLLLERFLNIIGFDAIVIGRKDSFCRWFNHFLN